MKKIFALLLYIILVNHAQAQSIAINTDGSQPNASAMLDIKNANKGLLIPRINLVSETDVATIQNPINSLLVFNNNAALPNGQGFYFWNGNKWSKLATTNTLSNFSWGIAGNSSSDTDFIGTTNNKPLVFKTNNILSGKIDAGLNDVFFGRAAGKAVTTGTNNSFFGDQAGFSTTIGNTNTAIGSNALYSGSGTIANVAIGFNSLYSSTLGYYNTAIGNSSLYTNTTGKNNVADGYETLYSNTSGNSNTATGYFAMHENTTGDNNVADGIWALSNSTTARFNTAIGSQALLNDLTGSENVSVGFNSSDANTDGSYNTAIGMEANYLNHSGNYNVANGHKALYNNSSSFNVAVGAQALYENSIGTDNVGAGYQALYNNTTGNYNATVGYKTMYFNTTGNYNVALGAQALNDNTSGTGNTAFGYQAMSLNTTGTYNTLVGYKADVILGNLTNAIAIGSNAYVSTSNTMVMGNDYVDRWAFGITTTNANHAMEVGYNGTNGNGAYLTQGGNWTNTSSRIKKEDFSDISGTDLLQKIQNLPIQKWKYKGTNEYHIGPVAEDFYKLFGLGTDDKGISTVDPSGIALAAIKELTIQNEEMKQMIKNQNEQIVQLRLLIESIVKK
ncbi:MAG: tail fiber domain-containing protein [Ginsengibacter sp.]